MNNQQSSTTTDPPLHYVPTEQEALYLARKRKRVTTNLHPPYFRHNSDQLSDHELTAMFNPDRFPLPTPIAFLDKNKRLHVPNSDIVTKLHSCENAGVRMGRSLEILPENSNSQEYYRDCKVAKAYRSTLQVEIKRNLYDILGSVHEYRDQLDGCETKADATRCFKAYMYRLTQELKGYLHPYNMRVGPFGEGYFGPLKPGKYPHNY